MNIMLDYLEFPLFGLYVTNGGIRQVSKSLIQDTKNCKRILVVTPNVDHFMRWKNSEKFRKVYELANYRVLDGKPLVWLSKILGNSSSERITGVDLTYSLLELAQNENISINIIGGSYDALRLAEKRLKSIYPQLIIEMLLSPSAEDLENVNYFATLARKLSPERPRLVLICLGSPKQEFFYARLRDFNITGTFLCVGATIDFLAGTINRAPKLFQNMGLEWMYRFSQEPRRLFRRYFVDDAPFIFFLLLAIICRTISPFIVRRKG